MGSPKGVAILQSRHVPLNGAQCQPRERSLHEATLIEQPQPPTDSDAELFRKLRALRKRLADEQVMPAYTVFSDATLRSMAVERPSTRGELLSIKGVGRKKLDLYGAASLEVMIRSSRGVTQ